MWKGFLGSFLLIVSWTATASADVTLTGSQSLVVDSFHNADYMLYDTSRLDVTQAGYIDGGVFAQESGALAVSDGGYVRIVVMNSISRLAINQGTVDSFNLVDGSVATLSGAVVNSVSISNNGLMTGSSSAVGNIKCYDNANLFLSDGSLGGLDMQGHSTASLTDVILTGGVRVGQAAHLEIHGGYVPNLWAQYGTADLFSGDIAVVRSDAAISRVTFYGSDFLATDGLSFSGDQVIGTGTLSGKWLDGSAFSTAITQNTGTIYAVPEPASLSLLALGGLALLRRKPGYAG